VRHLLNSQPFILSWGDILIEPPQYSTLVHSFETFNRNAESAQRCETLLALNYMDDPWRGAAVYVDPDWRVTRLVEKPARGTSSTHWNNAGIFIFDPVILQYAERLQPSERGEYELPQAIAAMISDGRMVRGFPLQGFWSDLGTPEDLADAERLFNRQMLPGA
jgi:dTDP-glucose pyrophosphorylase